MFVLSKLFWLIVQPLAFAFLSMLAALACLAFSKTGAAAVFAMLAALTLGVTSFTNLGAVLLADLEARFRRPVLAEPPGCAIVLGGGINTGASARRGTYVFTRAADRYIEALRLARLYPEMVILVTGGDNALTGAKNGEAEPAARFFADHGIAPERLLYEPDARNTAENAANTAKMLKDHAFKGPCLLVTSAYHMPRSAALFEKAGVDTLPWPADYRTDGRPRLSASLDRPMTNAAMLTTALREWAGLVTARLRGHTARLSPRQED
ncbi:YdcF family protein [Martelella lutilitoris]|uniref:YdcF family protein n=1 Tax=Martelella lutilitoris TaxID=2583532 RepID=A0A5C4JLR9_9HYPH|nr:YdcF family protein [Martelella lutilitoris]TNB46415.1 YdcF family protein [Martelella lutilitoris]